VITLADRPDALSPSSPSRAGRKSFVDKPRRYRIGSTSATFGDLRMYGGRILLVNFWRSPSITRLSLTLCASTSIVPAPVVIRRALALPLRTTSRCPSSPRSASKRSTYSATSASSALISIFRAPRKTRSSSWLFWLSSRSSSFSTIVNMGGVSFPSSNWGCSWLMFTRKDTPPFSCPPGSPRSTTFGYTSNGVRFVALRGQDRCRQRQ